VPVYLRKLLYLQQIRAACTWLVKGATLVKDATQLSTSNWTWLRLSISDWSIIMVCPSDLLLVKGATQLSTSNWTWLRLSISDWSIIMVCPSDLLLVVPTYMEFQLIGGVAKLKTAKLRHLIWLSRVTYWALVEMLQLCSICNLAKIFFTSKFSYLLFCNPTHKAETGTTHRWGTTNSKPSWGFGSVLSGSLSSVWPASFGLFACLDFGPCPLVSFSLPFLGAFCL